MIVYRYEKLDKGGVFFTLNGINRISRDCFIDNWISCCESKELLQKWFSDRNIDVSDCYIVTYDIPKELIKHTKTHLIFPKECILNQ